jgi:rod shape determining protein RodA
MIEAAGSHAAGSRARERDRAELLALLSRLDWLLLAGVGALVLFGLWAVAGITRQDVDGDESYFVVRQAVFAAAGAVGLVAIVLVPPAFYRRFHRHLLGALVASIALVFVVGFEARGSQRWISLGFFQLQPSEIGKLLLVLFLAGFLAERHRRTGEWRTVMTAVGLALVPTFLVVVQPDLGTSLVYCAAIAAAVFLAGARWLHLGVLAAAGAFVLVSVLWLLPGLGVDVLEDYQRARLTAFANPEADLGGTGYNVDQSRTAVGSGGLTGRGVEGATQTNYDYLPEHATDFAFASLAEQRGFVGAAALLLLYLLVLWRGLRIVSMARDPFSAIAAGSLVFALLFQIFVNVGMTMGIAPVTGIPLPFVSVGGSAMLTNLLAMGVLLAIHARSVRDRRG